jgi:hypothetical protein
MGRPSQEDEKDLALINLKGISGVLRGHRKGGADGLFSYLHSFHTHLQKTGLIPFFPFAALISLGSGANGSGTDWVDPFAWVF